MKHEVAAPLRRLVDRFEAWDASFAEGQDDESLGRAERTALLDELREAAGEREGEGVTWRAVDPWQILAEVFSPRASSSQDEHARIEAELLRAYEQACELPLPFHLSSMLMRHYGAIKRAAHVAHGRLHLPTPPRGFARPLVGDARLATR